jgi:AcrR family transcriptional regulator
MPKIIENLQSRLIEEAKRQIEESGYAALTIRSVAKGCGVGVGTVYNYFSSKDDLIANYMLSDWNQCVAAIRAVGTYSDSPRAVMRCMYDQLYAYAERHQVVFRDESATANFAGSVSRYHGILRSQLADPVRRFCGSDFASEFIAEAMLAWTMAGKSFDEIYGMIEKLF